MFENPQNAAQQIANLAERVATEMRVLLNTVLGKADKDHTHTAEQVTGLDEIYATKEELSGSTAGADGVHMLQQWIEFYNGYHGTSLDYRDYLTQPFSEVIDSFYAFANGYYEDKASGE